MEAPTPPMKPPAPTAMPNAKTAKATAPTAPSVSSSPTLTMLSCTTMFCITQPAWPHVPQLQLSALKDTMVALAACNAILALEDARTAISTIS